MPNERLRTVCSSLAENFYNAKKAYDEKYRTEIPAFDKFKLDVTHASTDDKLKRTYKKLISLIPEDKKLEAHAKIEEYFKATFKNEKSFLSMKKRITDVKEYFPTQKEKDVYLFERPTTNFFFEADTKGIFNTILDYLDGIDLDGTVDDIENYKSAYEFNYEIYPWAEEIEELKRKNAETITDEKKLKELNDELDIIARIVVTSPEEYTKKYESYEDKVAHQLNVETDEINERQLKSEQYSELNDYFRDYSHISNDVSYGVRHIAIKHVTNPNVANEFLKEDRRFIIPEDKKNALRKILNLMKERGMFSHVRLGESGGKEYSFTQIGDAQKKLHDLLKSGVTDVNEIRQAREEYERTLQNMRDVYKLIEEEIGPDSNMAVGNVSSYRTSWVPNEFKNNIFVNGYANAIYNLGAMMGEVGIDYDEMLDNPSEVFFKCIKHLSKNLTPNDVVKGYSPARSFNKIFSLSNTPGYPTLAVGRLGEFLRQLTAGTEYFEQNTMALLLAATYDSHVAGLVQNGYYSSIAGFFNVGDQDQTAANILIVNDEDRDYNKLRSFEAVTVDGMETIPPFNAIEYLENHKVDPANLIERLNDTVKMMFWTAKRDEFNMRMARTIRAAQVAAYDFLMIHPTPDLEAENAFFTKEQYDSLRAIVDTPEKVFGVVIANDLRDEKARYEALSDFSKGIEQTGAAALKGRELSEEEKDYCQKIEDIKKRLSGKEAEAAISELLAQETERLDKEEKFFGEFINKNLHEEMANYKPMSEYITNVERTGEEAIKNARKEARKAEKNYGKQLNKIKKTLTGKEAEAALADLRAKEIERLEKAYCEGKLPSDYFEQRRFNVEQGKEKATVPFGTSERPSFSKFKKEYAKELSAEEIQTLYDRMMNNARRAENKFILTATGKQPKPTLESADRKLGQEKTENEVRVQVDVSKEVNDSVTEFSEYIKQNELQLNNVKEV